MIFLNVAFQQPYYSARFSINELYFKQQCYCARIYKRQTYVIH